MLKILQTHCQKKLTFSFLKLAYYLEHKCHVRGKLIFLVINIRVIHNIFQYNKVKCLEYCSIAFVYFEF